MNYHFVTHFDPTKKLRRKILIVINFFNKQAIYVKIELMPNEKIVEVYFGKDETLVKL